MWFDRNQQKLLQAEENKRKELAQRMEDKKTKFKKKFGKPSTMRSQKEKFIKVEKKKEIDPETLDQLNYLGLDL